MKDGGKEGWRREGVRKRKGGKEEEGGEEEGCGRGEWGGEALCAARRYLIECGFSYFS